MPCRRSHTLYRTDSRCRALSRNISHCLSAGTASDHLLDVFRSSAGCRRRPPAPGGKKGAGGSALPPGTAPELAAQGVYVNTPRRHAGLRRLQAACVHSDTLLMRPSAGRPAGWSAGTRRVKSQAVASRPAESRISSRCTRAAPGPIPLHPRSTRPDPAASPQHTARSAASPHRPLTHFPVGKNFRVKGGLRS